MSVPALQAFREPDIGRALERVGATLEELRELLGSLIADGRVYVVGSLAAGLGNRGSDIDVNVFVGDATRDAPMMFFLGDISVDLQYYAADHPARMVAELPDESARVAGAPCALAPAPPAKPQRRLSRWVTACPFDADEQPLYDGADVERIQAALVRGALEAYVLTTHAARVADAAGPTARIAWSRAGRAVLEVLARVAGDLFIGDKWIAARAARSGVAPELVERAFAAASESEVQAVAAEAGLPELDPSALVVVEPAPNLEPVKIGNERWTLVNGVRILPGAPEEHAPDRLEGRELLNAFAERLVTARVDQDGLTEALRS